MGSQFARSTQHRIVEAGGREYRVPPASTRTGLLLYEALDAALPREHVPHGTLAGALADADAAPLYDEHDDQGASAADARDAEAGPVATELIAAWLPPEISALVLGLPVADALATLYWLLDDDAAGETAASETGAAEARTPRDVLRDIAIADWDLTLDDVADLWHTSPLAVLEAPFGAFLAAGARSDAFEARRTLRAGSAAALPHMTEEGLSALVERASGVRADAGSDGPASAEKIATDRARLRALFGGAPPDPDPTGP